MKNAGVFIIGIMMFTFSCGPAVAPTISSDEQLAIDTALIDAWLLENEIDNVIIHPTGIRYTVNKVGTGPKVEVGNIVRLTYEGRLLETGDIFDAGQTAPAVFNAGWSFISGWYHVVFEMSEGDEYTAYFPSKYAYGTRGQNFIGPNSVLVFDMSLDKIGN